MDIRIKTRTQSFQYRRDFNAYKDSIGLIRTTGNVQECKRNKNAISNVFISRKGSSIIQRFKIPIFSAGVQVPEKMEFKIYSFTFIISYLPVQLAEY